MSAPITVAYDGSQQSSDAVEWAVTEARHWRRPLRIITVSLALPPLRRDSQSDVTTAHNAVKDIAREMAEETLRKAPDLDVQYEVIEAPTAAGGLIPRSSTWEMLVLGTHGRGGFTGMLVGSSTTQVCAYSMCPVVVARKPYPESAPVTVGVDGSRGSRSAVGFALREAWLRDVPLNLVHAWRHPKSARDVDFAAGAELSDYLAADRQTVMTRSLAGLVSRFRDVPITRRSVQGGTRTVLLRESAHSSLLVVGARGRGGFTGLLLGSTSQAMIHHAKIPVAVVHGTETPSDGTRPPQ
ncbi:universal stress protein [Stackebrandtia nassauensis]|uniref:UspA domain protein n=1 Tax=Stackebrandtia nassauensis (strain DSM 44728 / CIP 108903 / NRRL B-16338 / NBRC 102104 / LLR-40K-21) TaxID=446470 RepID=D3PVM6_STANL|nr:universal stress protein [Stackebrandtia nassauensis]ADD43140.1 UspA domain protein [Stackebrandtia nassauensis DSM 44728]